MIKTLTFNTINFHKITQDTHKNNQKNKERKGIEEEKQRKSIESFE